MMMEDRKNNLYPIVLSMYKPDVDNKQYLITVQNRNHIFGPDI